MPTEAEPKEELVPCSQKARLPMGKSPSQEASYPGETPPTLKGKSVAHFEGGKRTGLPWFVQVGEGARKGYRTGKRNAAEKRIRRRYVSL